MSADHIRTALLKKLSQCRGQRAYGVSLLPVLAGGEQTERRLHNLCVPLYQQGLIERQRGMYALTSAGRESLQSVN